VVVTLSAIVPAILMIIAVVIPVVISLAWAGDDAGRR
jgi:hypothetical protein